MRSLDGLSWSFSQPGNLRIDCLQGNLVLYASGSVTLFWKRLVSYYTCQPAIKSLSPFKSLSPNMGDTFIVMLNTI